jgi:serine protease Do
MPLNFSELPQPGAPAAILPQNFSELAAPTDPAGTLNSKGEKKKRGLKKRGLKRAVPAYAGTLNGEEVKKNSGLKNAGTPNGEEVKRTRGLKVMVGAMFAFSVAFGVYCIVSDVMNPQTGGNEQYALATYDKPVEKEREITQNTLMTPAEIAERCLPAIAEIYTFADSFMGSVQGSGSGIVMSSDGLIITNAHVIADADIIKVKISGKREMDAQVIGIDAKTDIAVIKIPASGLPAAELGNSDQVKIGEDVVVLGNPAGLTGSVTNGIVSGINRAMGNGRYEMKYIQTNAAISPGNSGGALLNMYGQVIGITSLKYVSQGYEGLGFAISINDAKPIIEALISDGQITGRTRIGIQFVASGDSESGFVGVFEEYFGKKPPEDLKGLLVSEIDFECDIYNTELRPMDIITKMQDKDIETMDDVSAILDGKKTGDKLTAHVVRFRKDNGERLEFDIEFALMADGE